MLEPGPPVELAPLPYSTQTDPLPIVIESGCEAPATTVPNRDTPVTAAALALAVVMQAAQSDISWDPNSGNPIGNGWQNCRHILGCGDGIILAIKQNGDLFWYQYQGNGESNRSGSTGWHPNSGNPIGNGWKDLRNVFVAPQEGRTTSPRFVIYGVKQDGDLLWYSYHGNGESDRSGTTGWHQNSGNPIGNGWQDLREIFACGGVIFGVKQNGDLLWYSYWGNGESDRSGSTGWSPNSGNPIGNGWQEPRALFGGSDDSGGFGQVIYAVAQSGDLLWYRYDGHGESDRSGSTGWNPNSGNPIGNGW